MSARCEIDLSPGTRTRPRKAPLGFEMSGVTPGFSKDPSIDQIVAAKGVR
jgi:hypothetical protein